MSSHSLLLRLFNSEFFNPWFAVSYLHRYPDNIGIQHYLCDRLKEFPNKDLQFFLPQLCHFLITHPSAVAVELLLLELSQRSNHFAIQVLHPSYHICRRVLKKCQQLLFQDQVSIHHSRPNKHSNKPAITVSNLATVTKVRENLQPSLVGLGAILAGFACPRLAQIPARMAIAEGSKPPPLPPLRTHLQPNNETNPVAPRPSSARLSASPDISTPTRRRSADARETASPRDTSKLLLTSSNPPSPGGELISDDIVDLASPSLEDLRNGHAFSFFQHLNKRTNSVGMAQQRPSSGDLSELNITDDKLRGLSEYDDSPVASDSECSDPFYKPNLEISKGRFFHSEIQFVLTLMSISNRLCLVPKASRQSSLQAELALLNHNLPADICIPMWCEATPEKPSHHKLVRISPKDAVVLNSAERVPFLVFVEVLMDEKGTEIEQAEEQKLPVSIPRSYALSGALPDAFGDVTDAGSSSAQNQLYFQSVMSRRSSTACDEYAESMRTAAVMLAQLTLEHGSSSPIPPTTAKANNHRVGAKETIRERIITEMAALEESRVAKIKRQGADSSMRGAGGEGQGGELVNEQELLQTMNHKEDPSAAVFREDWDAKQKRIRAASPFGDRNSWRLLPLIVKTGADLRQEQFALQLIREMERIWAEAGLDIWIQRFNIMVTSNDTGFVEMVRNTISIHSLKKDAYTRGINTKGVMYSLYDHFVREFGDPSSPGFMMAQDNFLKSLAGYSLISYILQLKDRHNGNILVDTQGHLVHIDFGFMLSNSPGSVGFEMAPFKMTQEYLDILGGANSTKFKEFRNLMHQGLLALRKHAENLLLLVEMMQKDSKLPCFSGGGPSSIISLKERFHLGLTNAQLEDLIDKMIVSSSCNVFTRLYDTFQYYSNGIL